MNPRSILHRLAALLRPSRRRSSPPAAPERGRSGATATVEIDPRSVGRLRLTYAPARDGRPDGGEVVWTWVPYAERDGRGKDRPVLVIAPQDADRVYAVKLTSQPRDGGRDYVPIGAGEWDAKGRPSWVDIDQLYSVHAAGMRREASAVDRSVFARVAEALRQRHGYTLAR